MRSFIAVLIAFAAFGVFGGCPKHHSSSNPLNKFIAVAIRTIDSPCTVTPEPRNTYAGSNSAMQFPIALVDGLIVLSIEVMSAERNCNKESRVNDRTNVCI
jgi:hypothetical protein